MICFIAGIILGVYLCRNYDIERICSDVKSNIFKCESSVWQSFKNTEKKYRKEQQESNTVADSGTATCCNQSSAPTLQQMYPTFALGSTETQDTLKDQ
ncbi:hypothetical protein C9374_014634 [Naegleria lovaniensis]|uniref:Uncharacterized protein n=1 Tax=Naegleria lovaniensis TaxID=51637 RepID=A0AA88H0D3_NAELO|nr:uncharacterized protein C9374_014634 [Naegleria lovaniensis]KAG2389234.1 hypothetical protein C9374_014634 [Naegleria lovaniensis]